MNLPFNLPDPPAPFKRKLDLAKMNQKVKKEKAVPVIPPGVALRPPGFFIPLQEVRPLVEPTPPPVVFIGNVLQAQIDERARARQALEEAKAREANGGQEGKKQEQIAPANDRKPSKKSRKPAGQEDEQKKEKEMKIRPEYPMTKYEDRDDHPTYNGRFLYLQKQRGNIKVVGPEYCFGLAENNILVDYEDPRAPPQPTTPPLHREYPVSPSLLPVQDDGMVDVTQSTPPSFMQTFRPAIPVANITRWPSYGHKFSAIVLPTDYSDYPTEQLAELTPPAQRREDHILPKQQNLANEREEMIAREVDRSKAARRTRQASDASSNSASERSFHSTTVSSETTARTSPSEANFPHHVHHGGEEDRGEHVHKPFTPFAQPDSAPVWPSDDEFPLPHIWSKERDGSWSQEHEQNIRVAPITKAGPHEAALEKSPAREHGQTRPSTPPRIARPQKPTHHRASSRRAVYFTAEQITGSPGSSSPPPTPPPKDSPLAPIPPYKPLSQSKDQNVKHAALGRLGTSPTSGSAFSTTLPLKIHKRNPSNNVVPNTRDVYDYASVTTSRAGHKPQGPPPVLRHHGRMRIITPPPRLDSLPINVKSNARPSTSMTKFRTHLDHELRAGHSRSASEMATQPKRAEVSHPQSGRSVSALGHYRDQPPRQLMHPMFNMARSQSPSASTPNYGMRPSAANSTTNGKFRAHARHNNPHMANEFGQIQPVQAQRTLPYHSNTVTGIGSRPAWI